MHITHLNFWIIPAILGGEFGGSIGTLLFFAKVVTAALYSAGCAEGNVTYAFIKITCIVK